MAAKKRKEGEAESTEPSGKRHPRARNKRTLPQEKSPLRCWTRTMAKATSERRPELFDARRAIARPI